MSAELQISTVFIELSQHETESGEKIYQIMENLFPSDLHDETRKLLRVYNLSGFHKNQIKLFKIHSIKQKLNKKIFDFIINKIIPETDFETIWNRFSFEDFSLYLRINKQELLKSKQFKLDEGSDIVKIVFKFLFFSKIRSDIKEIKEYLNNQLFG